MRIGFLFLSLLVLAGASGCTMCASTYDCHYAGFGGIWQRGDRIHGRVGSAFNNAQATLADSADVFLAPEYEFLGPEEDSDRKTPSTSHPDSSPTGDRAVEELPMEANRNSKLATPEKAASPIEAKSTRQLGPTEQSLKEIRELGNKVKQPSAGGVSPPEPLKLDLK